MGSFGTGMGDVLRSIDDEAIDEAYPPTAQEAAELEAVELFVELMATLAHLEEREERTRFHPDRPGLGKRWMSRRELVGKPHPAKHSVQPVVHHQHRQLNPSAARDNDGPEWNQLVAQHNDPRHPISVKEHKTHERVLSRMARQSFSNKNNKKMNRNRQHIVPIQQPRKNS